jgi:hypothetical protein
MLCLINNDMKVHCKLVIMHVDIIEHQILSNITLTLTLTLTHKFKYASNGTQSRYCLQQST